MTLQDRFQRAMERVARAAGHWAHFALWAGLFVAWLAFGPVAHWSDSYQLIWNGLTTTVELFLGLALLVDGALMTRLQFEHATRQEAMLGNQALVLAHLDTLVTLIDTREQAIQADVAAWAGERDV